MGYGSVAMTEHRLAAVMDWLQACMWSFIRLLS